MKKKIGLWIFLSVSLSLLLVACGEKSSEKVIEKLEETVESMDGYHAEAEMLMNIGQDEQNFAIDIRHQKDDFYRVELANHQSEHGEQVILKNEDGVYVLTPELNKKFKFQTEWPHDSSQPYLYQSLVEDIVHDEDATFEVTDDYYIFEVKTTNQTNENLPFQEIYINKKDYTPAYVKIMDIDKNVLVEVNFLNFILNPTFEGDEFTTEDIIDEESAETLKPEEDEEDERDEVDEEETETEEPFTILFPLFTAGAELSVKKTVELDDGERVLMTFTGDKNFTLVQEKTDVIPTISYPKEVTGDIVNLGFTLGALTEKGVEWTYQGVDFYLASDELTSDELTEIAQSVQGQAAK